MAMGEPLDREDIRWIVEQYIENNLSIRVDHEVKSEYVSCSGGYKDYNIVSIKVLLDDKVIDEDSFSFECNS